MTDRIDPVCNGMQPPGREAMVDGVFAKPKLQQLPPCDHPVLPLRQPRHSGVGVRAKPSRPAYIAG